MKKVISFLLMVSIMLSIAIVPSINVGAVSYRDKFIKTLLNNESKWIYCSSESAYFPAEAERINYSFYFMDLNCDGKKELLVHSIQGSGSINYIAVFDMKKGKLHKAGILQQNKITGYYNKKTKKYCFLSSSISKVSHTSHNGNSCNVIYKKNKAEAKQYSSFFGEVDLRTYKTVYTYYNEKYETITKTEYNRINKNKKKNLVNIKMKTKRIKCKTCEKMTKAKKKKLLVESYNANTWNKKGKK